MLKDMPAHLPLALHHFRPGDRVAVAVSGGADSVALLRALDAAKSEAGLVLRVVHFHHGLRGAEADADAAFVRGLADVLGLRYLEARGETAARAEAHGESVEEAARILRYDFFRELLAGGEVDAIATAHTRDDQAETVLLKFMRGAWTEGLGGISPVVHVADGRGRIVRPLLEATRAQVEHYLLEVTQHWREDSTNANTAFTRNRLRHELMPQLRSFNPNLDEQLTRLASIARDEEAHWQIEMERLLPQVLLEGRPVRGGGRSVSTSSQEKTLALDVARLSAWDTAVQRRILRAAARQLGADLDFGATARLGDLLGARSGAKATLGEGLLAERSARELRISMVNSAPKPAALTEIACPVPGMTEAAEFGLRVLASAVLASANGPVAPSESVAILRIWKPGDRIRLRHTLKEQKVKEALQRLRASAEEKACWPVLTWQQRVVWMRGVEVQAVPADPVFQVTPIA